MLIPSSISKNTLKAYEYKGTNGGTIKSWDFVEWDAKIPNTLRQQCIECLAKYWLERPILEEIETEDKQMLLEILPLNMPLEVTVSRIHEEVYWKKSFLTRWPKTQKKLPSAELKPLKSWKSIYCEAHLQKYLEHLQPDQYQAEKIKQLGEICGPYVQSLEISQMMSIRSGDSAKRIPLNDILMVLPGLKKLSLRFKQIHTERGFFWNIMTTSLEDVALLAKGLETTHLHTLRITSSDIDGHKATELVMALSNNEHLKILDFSRCKVGNEGASAIGRFVQQVPLEQVHLASNRIDLRGLKTLAYALSLATSHVEVLDLSFNQFSDPEANVYIRVLTSRAHLKNLLISGCGLGHEFYLGRKLKILKTLNISNNRIGKEAGLKLLDSLKYNNSIMNLDIRICAIPSELEALIQNEIHLNRKKFKEPLQPSEDLEKEDISWDEALLLE
ncbi:hypothetical protein ABEB36_012037 [Hypothenemus hampei]|uniref:T-complex-associated testis-expressed protein 1 n=1 Tax=Hypothenemus hampei TaxID=57062 RepID=A0ABD1E9V6_HYPHA